MVMQTLFYAVNRSDITLRLTVFRFVADLVLLLITLRYGALWIAVGCLAGNYLFFAAYCVCSAKYIGYSCKQLIKDLRKPLLSAAVCFGAAFAVSLLQIPMLLALVLQVGAGAVAYFAMSLLLQDPILLTFLNKIKSKLKK